MLEHPLLQQIHIGCSRTSKRLFRLFLITLALFFDLQLEYFNLPVREPKIKQVLSGHIAHAGELGTEIVLDQLLQDVIRLILLVGKLPHHRCIVVGDGLGGVATEACGEGEAGLQEGHLLGRLDVQVLEDLIFGERFRP